MKTGRLLWSYSTGVRIVAAVMMVIAFFALFTTVQAVASLRYAYSRYAFIARSGMEDAWYFNKWANMEEDVETQWEFTINGWRAVQDSLAAMPGVAFLARIDQLLYSMYEDDSRYGDSTPMYLLNPGMLTLFPTLREAMPFDDPAAVYLIGNCFAGKKAGDTVNCYSDPHSRGTILTLRVGGRCPVPFALPKVSMAGTSIDAEMFMDMIGDRGMVLLDTPENRALLTKKKFDVLSGNGFFLRYEENATAAEMDAVEAFMVKYGSFSHTGEVKKGLEAELLAKFMNLLPRCFFMMAVTVVTYISMIVLTVSKKRKEIAVSCICGASKRKSAGLLTGMLFSVTLLPAALNLLYIAFSGWLSQKRILFGDDLLFDGYSIAAVLVYAGVMLLVAWLLVKGLIARKSPIDYFKEVTQ